jgi:hypothetical protein
MNKRGRKSAVEAGLVVIKGNFDKGRPDPPDDLTDEQKATWRSIAGSEPKDFLATAALQSMLKDYCRARSEIERLSRIIAYFQDDWIKPEEGARRLQLYLRMRNEESKRATDLATKMRLTNQSRYTPQAAATASRNTLSGPKPWES